MLRDRGAFFVDVDSIRLKHGSVANFLKSENIQRIVFDSLRKKRSFIFKNNSKARQAFVRLNELGYIRPANMPSA